MQEIIKSLKSKIDYYRSLDLHIGEYEPIPDMRMKDMNFGKLVAYEEIYELLNGFNIKE